MVFFFLIFFNFKIDDVITSFKLFFRERILEMSKKNKSAIIGELYFTSVDLNREGFCIFLASNLEPSWMQ